MLLYKRHHYFYQLFRSANKASNRIFSTNCWRSSSTIFGGQCLQIQQRNKNFSQFHCQFPYHQKLCQRYQFYSTGNDGIHPLPVTADDGANSSLANESENSSSLPYETANSSSPADGGENNSPLANENENSSSLPNEINDSANSSSLPDENANSSSSTTLPKIPTTNAAMEQKEQHKIRTITNNLIFNDYFRLSKSNGTVLKLRFAKGKRGHKFFEMSAKHDNMPLIIDFGKILFPEDAYAFVRILDELILELATKNVGQKLLNQGKSQPAKRLLKVRTVEMIGKLRKFQLELLFFPNEGKADIKPELCILLLAFKLPIENNNNSTPIHLLLPLRALPWLREQMADMLVRHNDGTETIAREAPAKIPIKYLL